MARTNDIKKAAMAKVATRPSRPNLAKMRQRKSSVTKGKTHKVSTPKMVGKRKSVKTSKSLAKPSQRNAQSATTRSRKGYHLIDKLNTYTKVAQGFRKSRPSRYRSGRGAAKIVPIPDRHYPSSGRLKTGWHRIVREPWDTNETFAFKKAIFRMANEAMSKGMKKASLGKDWYGKKGPGHSGYGSGTYQNWTDYVLHKNQGLDPHIVDLRYLAPKYLNALNYHFGGDFLAMTKASKKDQYHFLRDFIDKNKDAIPELRNLTKRDVNLLIEHNYHTVTFGPDGRKK